MCLSNDAAHLQSKTALSGNRSINAVTFTLLSSGDVILKL
jgi:hypothetical protein